MKNRLLILIACAISSVASAHNKEKGHDLPEVAVDALYHLSICGEKLGKYLINEYWIGSAQKRVSSNKDYSYFYDVYSQGKEWSTVQMGTITVKATYIPDPPADAGSYEYECKFTKYQP